MEKKQRRGKTVSFKYVDHEREEIKDFTLNNYASVKNFVENRFPSQKHLISKYLHYAMVMLEEIGVKKDVQFNEKSWDALSKKWKNIFFSIRNNLTREQRIAFFVVRARFDSFKELIKNKLFEKEKEDYGREELTELLIDKNPLKEDSVSMFWMKFKVLDDNFFKLKYSKVLHRFFKRFYIAFGKYIWMRSGDDKIFDNPLYCNPGKDGLSNINEYFIESCEYKMSGMQMMLDSYKKIVYPRLIVNESNPNSSKFIYYNNVLKQRTLFWIFEQIKKNFLEASEKNFQEMMYKVRVNPGEFDKFVDENKYVEAVPFNILSQYKKTLFDQIADLFDKKEALLFVFGEYMESFKKQEKKIANQQKNSNENKKEDIFDSFLFDTDELEFSNQQKHTIDVDIFCLALSMLNYGYQQVYMIKDNFQTTFFINNGYISKLFTIQEAKKVLENINLSRKIPLFYYHFNEILLFYKEKFIRFQDFLSCYIHWIKLCCEDKEILGMPFEGVDLTKQYTLLFPENKELIKQIHLSRKMKNKHQQTLSLPSFYPKEDMLMDEEEDLLETKPPF